MNEKEFCLKLEDLELNKRYEDILYEIDNVLQNSDDLHQSLKFSLYLKSGYICINYLNDFDSAISYLMKTYSEFERVEGLLLIVKHYHDIKRFSLAYALSIVCLFTKKFDNVGCSDLVYEYDRYLTHACICLNMGRYTEGIENIKKSIDFLSPEMEFYEEQINICRDIFEKLNDGLLNDKK